VTQSQKKSRWAKSEDSAPCGTSPVPRCACLPSDQEYAYMLLKSLLLATSPGVDMLGYTHEDWCNHSETFLKALSWMCVLFVAPLMFQVSDFWPPIGCGRCRRKWLVRLFFLSLHVNIILHQCWFDYILKEGIHSFGHSLKKVYMSNCECINIPVMILFTETYINMRVSLFHNLPARILKSSNN
jgi:hypothetical protein